ncbi:MAG: RimK family alpha-L-glutamate ligase [Anaerolineales bacterium]|nr:RimK family alpha-L-glutamate ligase [Anaerolineales bacterium]
MKVAILGANPGWHAEQLQGAIQARGHLCTLLPITQLNARVGMSPRLSSLGADLDSFDLVLVRFIPAGSLEQLIFRMDSLHLLEARGLRVVNRPTAIERTVDKLYTSGLLAQAGLPTPRTIACETIGDALKAFTALGGDVVVKPLFGAMGLGIVRIEDRDVAYRVFKALELERAVYYLQETIPHNGCDIRAFVIGGRVVAAIERVSDDWRTNVARGAQARLCRLTPEQEALCLRAAQVVGVDYAGVDLLPAADGRLYLIEVNSIPGWKGLQTASPVNIAEEIALYLETMASQQPAKDERCVLPRTVDA